MTYEEAKVIKQQLNEKVDADSATLKEFDKYGLGVMGLTPDHVKEMPEWKLAKQNFEKSFAELRNFNGWFVKQFKKEYAAERKNRFKKAN
jgi:hypothetical protein